MLKIVQDNYKAIIQNIADSSITENSLTGFSLLVGKNNKHKLLVVGRAVNGWVVCWKHREGKNQKKVNKIIRQLEERETEFLDWAWNAEGAKDYYPITSAFWRITKRITLDNGFSKQEENWSNSIAWSNLYKVSKAQRGNPSSKLCSLQFQNAKTILFEEITSCKPNNIVFLNGYNYWASRFIDENLEVQKNTANSNTLKHMYH